MSRPTEHPDISCPHCGCPLRDHSQKYGCISCPACDRTPEYIAAFRIHELQREVNKKRLKLEEVREHGERNSDSTLLAILRQVAP